MLGEVSTNDRETTKVLQGAVCCQTESTSYRWNVSEDHETTSGNDTGLNVDIGAWER